MIGAIVAGGLSEGTPPVTNSYESIATVTLGSGGAAAFTFSSIPQTFKHLQIRMISRSTVGGTGGIDIAARFNNDSTAGNYKDHQLFGDGSGAYSGVSNTAPSPTAMYAAWIPQSGTTSNTFAGSVIDILDYTNTSKNKTMRSLTGYDVNGGGYIMLRSGVWLSTAAVTQIDLIGNSGNIAQYSEAALYGIKG